MSRTKVDVRGVYNGKCKLNVQKRNFMLENDVKRCLDELKNKKCEGFDRIPVCIILDAQVKLLPPLPCSSMKFITHVKFWINGKLQRLSQF